MGITHSIAGFADNLVNSWWGQLILIGIIIIFALILYWLITGTAQSIFTGRIQFAPLDIPKWL